MAVKQSNGGVTCKVEEITPRMAEHWLATFNTGNFRKIDQARVTCYAADIKAGLWDLNGESIVFGASGKLHNGQHRLAAVIKAGKSIESVVVRGVPRLTPNIDRGQPRRVSQWVAHGGVKNASIVAAVSRLCVGYQKGYWTRKGWGVGTMTDNEILAFAERHQEDINSSTCGTRIAGLPMSTFVAVMFIGCEMNNINDSEIACWFRDAIVSGKELSDTDPAYHFRHRIQGQRGAVKIPGFMLRMLLTLAWNKTVIGESCTANGLRIRLTGPGKQSLPDTVMRVDDIQRRGDRGVHERRRKR